MDLFISYSHDNELHKNKVLSLSNSLRKHGLNCEIDQYNSVPKEGWVKWMSKQIEFSDYIIVVFSKGYYDKIYENKSSGINFESNQIFQILFDRDQTKTKIVSVIFDQSDKEHIPHAFKSYTNVYNIGNNNGYKDLYLTLTKQCKEFKPPIGKLQKIEKESKLLSFNLGGKLEEVNKKKNIRKVSFAFVTCLLVFGIWVVFLKDVKWYTHGTDEKTGNISHDTVKEINTEKPKESIFENEINKPETKPIVTIADCCQASISKIVTINKRIKISNPNTISNSFLDSSLDDLIKVRSNCTTKTCEDYKYLLKLDETLRGFAQDLIEQEPNQSKIKDEKLLKTYNILSYVCEEINCSEVIKNNLQELQKLYSE